MHRQAARACAASAVLASPHPARLETHGRSSGSHLGTNTPPRAARPATRRCRRGASRASAANEPPAAMSVPVASGGSLSLSPSISLPTYLSLSLYPPPPPARGGRREERQRRPLAAAVIRPRRHGRDGFPLAGGPPAGAWPGPARPPPSPASGNRNRRRRGRVPPTSRTAAAVQLRQLALSRTGSSLSELPVRP